MMSICSLAFFNGDPCVVDVTGWHRHRHHAGPRWGLRHDERRVATSTWPPPGTQTWPPVGTFSWPRTLPQGARRGRDRARGVARRRVRPCCAHRVVTMRGLHNQASATTIPMAHISRRGTPAETVGDLPAVGTKAPGFTLASTLENTTVQIVAVLGTGLVDSRQPVITADDLGVTRGDGIFDATRVLTDADGHSC